MRLNQLLQKKKKKKYIIWRKKNLKLCAKIILCQTIFGNTKLIEHTKILNFGNFESYLYVAGKNK